MGSISQFTAHDHEVIARDYADLKEAARKRCNDQSELEMIQKAFDFANEAHKGVRRRSGEPYILHPIAVAKIVVSNIGLGYKSIVAALLHDVVEDTTYTVDDLRNLFGDKVAAIVEGLTKIKTVLDNEDKAEQKSMQAENFKRILLTLNDDVRVVLIKLADRLHNCRTIEYMPEHKRDKILSETMFVFIPLAHRLGLYSVKSEMEDIWLRFKEPEAYNEISAKINRNISDKDICDGIRDVSWPGRFDIAREDPLFIIDGGHNPQCLSALAKNMEDYLKDRKIIALTGVLADKDYGDMYKPVMPLVDQFVCITPPNPRRLVASELASHLRNVGMTATACDSIEDGVRTARDLAGKDGVVLCFGSLYTIGAIKESLDTLTFGEHK